jgi:hypothetical protein
MIIIQSSAINNFPIVVFGKKNEKGVDKRSNRDNPGDADGARPPRKKDYENAQDEKGKDKERNTGQEVDNEKKDKNKE